MGENFLCNLYSITTNQAAIIALFRVMNRYVGNLAPMPGVFPDYPASARPCRRVERHFSAVRGSEPLASVAVFVRGVRDRPAHENFRASRKLPRQTGRRVDVADFPRRHAPHTCMVADH